MRTVLLHFAFALAPLSTLAVSDSPALRIVSAAFLFVSVFAFVHDAMHRSLGLPRWANELVLSLGGALMGVSGAAARSLHLVHHARPGAEDDLEGQALRMTFGNALLVSPLTYLLMPFRAARRARSEQRRRQVVEWLLVVGFLGPALASGGAQRTYALVSLVANMSLQVWGSYLPHRAPPAALALARAIAWTRAPLVVSFAFHDLHHRRADLSCFDLVRRAETGEKWQAPAPLVIRATPRRRARPAEFADGRSIRQPGHGK